jgi:ubiquinone/menaquinone biosynthesis C-methylase UbiE
MGISNFELLQNDGKNIPVADASIDLVYSFIVLQHVEKIKIFNSYIEETYRILNDGGIAILFFGRLYEFSSNTQSKILYFIDTLLEMLHPKGYKEILTNVNCTNLKVSMSYAKKATKIAGFTILSQGVSKKLPGFQNYGGQHYLILKK